MVLLLKYFTEKKGTLDNPNYVISLQNQETLGGSNKKKGGRWRRGVGRGCNCRDSSKPEKQYSYFDRIRLLKDVFITK